MLKFKYKISNCPEEQQSPNVAVDKPFFLLGLHIIIFHTTANTIMLVDIKFAIIIVMVFIQLVLSQSVCILNIGYERRFLNSTCTHRTSLNGQNASNHIEITRIACIYLEIIVKNGSKNFAVSSIMLPNIAVCETMVNNATGYTSAVASFTHFDNNKMFPKKSNLACYPYFRLSHAQNFKSRCKGLRKNMKKHKRTGRGARFGRGGGWWRHKCPRRQAKTSGASVMWWLPNMCISFCERNFPGKSFRGCIAGDGPTMVDGTQVAGSIVHAMSLGDMSQLLQRIKGECRSGRCIIELSFDNQETFETFREHCSTVSTIKNYLQVNAIDFQFYVLTRRDDDGLYYHTSPDGLCSIRSALIAEKYANTVSERLPSDLNPMNSRNQVEMASYIRDRIQRIQLSTDELNFVGKAINFIEDYDLGQSPPSSIWPSPIT